MHANQRTSAFMGLVMFMALGCSVEEDPEVQGEPDMTMSVGTMDMGSMGEDDGVKDEVLENGCPASMLAGVPDWNGEQGPGDLTTKVSFRCNDTHLLITANGIPNHGGNTRPPEAAAILSDSRKSLVWAMISE